MESLTRAVISPARLRAATSTIERRRVRALNDGEQWPPYWAWPLWSKYRWNGRDASLTLADVYKPDIEMLVAEDLDAIFYNEET